MSWESSAEYYRLVNEAVRDRLGGLHSADCVLRSVDFTAIEVLQREDRWDEAGALLAAEARALVAAGAELLVLCTNTMHKVAGAIEDAVDVPFVHIADTTADAVRAAGFDTVGLLATAYTMEQDFYVGRLRDLHGLDVLVPGDEDRATVHRVIYEELCVGVVEDASRDEYRRIMHALAGDGAQAILLGCTEIDLLVGPPDAPVPVFDTTRLHAERAVDLALEIHGHGGFVLRVVSRRDDLLEMEATYPGTGGMPPEHAHPSQAERFEVLDGAMETIVGGVARRYAAGEAFDVPAGTPHQMGADGPSRVRWQVRPALRTAEFFERLYGPPPESFPDFLEEFSPEIRFT
jgi:aspartate racemase